MAAAEQVLAIAMVFLLLAGVVLLARRQGGWPAIGRQSGTTGPVELIQRLPLTPQHILHVVQAGAATVLVLTHPAGATVHQTDASFAEAVLKACRAGGEQPR